MGEEQDGSRGIRRRRKRRRRRRRRRRKPHLILIGSPTIHRLDTPQIAKL